MLPDDIESDAPVYIARRGPGRNPEISSVDFAHRSERRYCSKREQNIPGADFCQVFLFKVAVFFHRSRVDELKNVFVIFIG